MSALKARMQAALSRILWSPSQSVAFALPFIRQTCLGWLAPFLEHLSAALPFQR